MAQTTPLEQRLTEALAARAHQVEEADLAPGEVPGPYHRHRGLLVLAAAACTALVIGVPYGIAQLHGSTEPTPPLSTPTATPDVGVGADWPVRDRGQIDLDGDGSPEDVRLRVDPEPTLNPMGFTRARVEVALPTGTVFVLLADAPQYRLEGAVNLPGSPGQEELVSERSSLRVLGLVDGQLRVLDSPADPPLVRRTDNQGRAVTWTTDPHGLYSIRSVAPVGAEPGPYAVQRWHWDIAGGELAAEAPESGCVSPSAPETFVTCTLEPPQLLAPGPMDQFKIGDAGAPLDFTKDGHQATAQLVARPGFSGTWMNDGDVKLVVTAGTRTWEAPLGSGPIPTLVVQGVKVDSGPGVIVREQAFDGDGLLVFTWIDDRLVQLVYHGQDPDLGTTVNSVLHNQGHETFTWLQDGTLYSALGPDGSPKKVFRWQQSGQGIDPVLIGTYCFRADHTGAPC